MNVTVILCTYNRFQSLTQALDSVAVSLLPSSVGWEVLVVDNNSKDRTREVVEDFSRRYPGRFRYLFEPKQGKSHALNSGIREAQGEILAFMDDDVTVEPTWLQILTANLHDGQWAGAGGRVLPQRSFAAPSWLTLDGPHAMGGVLALFDLGNTPRELDVIPFGANMAVRKEMFAKYGVFRTDLGPSPGSEIRDEDTEFCRRLVIGLERLRYEPSAIVYHAVPESRLQKEYFLTWWFDAGRSRVRREGRRPAIWGIPRYYFRIPRVVVAHLPRIALQWMLVFDPRRRFLRKCWLWTMAGEVVEMYQLERHPNRPSQNCSAQL
jgi:glycosyltransferase involved in cell wall biosynthesis